MENKRERERERVILCQGSIWGGGLFVSLNGGGAKEEGPHAAITQSH